MSLIKLGKTNADRIRGLSDEGLAAFLAEWAAVPRAWRKEYSEIKHWLKETYRPKESNHAE